MAYPHCGNEGHALTVAVDRSADKLFRQVLTDVFHDIKWAISLVEGGQDRDKLRRLKIIEAMLKEELRD